MLVWRFAAPLRAVSSAALGGGIGPRHWVINATVYDSYLRDDPDAHLAELAGALGLDGAGVGLLTAVDVTRRVTTADDPSAGLGTINVVAFVPVRLADAALVNAIATVAEAKAQALIGLDVPATGTASDATCVLCPTGGPAEPYGGPRSTWGARLARAVHAAVRAGATRQ